MRGNTNFFYIPTVRGDKEMEQFFVGGSYTAGPFTIGANTFWGTYAGSVGLRLQHRHGRFRHPPPRTPNRVASAATPGRVGANYRLAPGLDLVAEWVRHVIHEPGVDSDAVGNNGVQDKLRANVFIVGTRLAF